MLLQNQEAAERRSREEKNVYHLKESVVGGLELGEVRGSQGTNTTPFNFIQLPQKAGVGWGVGVGGFGWGSGSGVRGGGGVWFSQQQSRRKRKVLKEGEKSEFYGIFSRGGPFFDGKTPFLFPLVD